MTSIPLYGGPLKKVLILRAYGMCGQSVTEFELTPEELDLGLTCMNDVAATLGTIAFNMPTNGNGNAEDESGIAASDALGFTVMLAQEVAQSIGKAFAPTGKQAQAKSALEGRYMALVSQTFARSTVRGAGNRLWPGPFFTSPAPDDEIAQ